MSNVKRFLATAIICMLFVNFPVDEVLASSSTAESNTEQCGVTARYVNVNSVIAGISKNGTQATCSVTVNNKKRVHTRIVMKLQRRVSGTWTTVKTWSKDHGKRASVTMRNSTKVSKGYSYRTYYQVTAGTEIISGSSSALTI